MIRIIKAFDEFLGKKGKRFSATIIGASALILMEVIDRATKDVDCLYPKVPDDIKQLSIEFSKWYSKRHKIPLPEDWLNNGPESLLRDIPKGWQNHIKVIYQGGNLIFSTLGRADLIRTKLFAYCDRQQDLHDCLALKPSQKELQDCYKWLTERDMNPHWPAHVLTALTYLAKELGYEFKP